MRTLLEAPFSLSKREAHAWSSCFVSVTDQSAAFGFGLGFSFPFDDDFPLSPEDKRKIVQIDDTSTKFHILDPLHVDGDLR